ncbi:isoprenyl transferase [Alkalicoccobacillus murimartini]|uniref:Isoprenyl transferase n=1 Tax=Alkalicoccobacillus murimartini TaxID=171685 RepID=A0ABT9YEP2_9BACI|nr:isoprenyl transferase [Alkalicoccobacillus murimartini]MDQ0206314.1 undecaprenyl diphosphate synthase [Alkalicoccobacillus murimartini]
MLERFSKWKANLTAADLPDHQVEEGNLPQHVAIIMDGNGRWAKKKGLPRIAGHREGMKVVTKIVRTSSDIGIEVLTLYAFSTENWKRPKKEVDYLLGLPERYLSAELPKLIKNNVQVRLMGTTEHLPDHTLKAVEKAIKDTKHNTGMILNFALNYGSRFEMLEAVKSIGKQIERGELKADTLTEEHIHAQLMTSQLKDPDLLIRTSGEIRLSNFMLWQLAYSEFWFSDILWPDFKEKDFLEAIAVYQKRKRRYGGV